MSIQETWGEYLKSSFEEHQDRIAVIDIGKNVRCTYRDLKRRIESIERALIATNITRGTHVAMLFPSSSKWIAVFIALINIGAVPVCLNCESTLEEIEYRIKHSDSKIVITNERIHSKIRSLEQKLALDLVVIENRQCPSSPGAHCGWNVFLDKGDHITKEEVALARNEVKYDDPLAIQYTSGTTGLPKAVVSVHYKVLNNMYTFSRIFNYTKDDVIFSSLPMYHVMGCFFSCLMTFMVGGSLVLMEKFNTERVIEALIEEKCTSFHGVPTMYKMILHNLGDREITSVNKGMIGGSCCDPETIDEIIEKMHISNIMPNYGQSEACGYTQTRLGDPLSKVNGTVGRPIEGVEIKIIDENGDKLPSDTIGEVVIKSDYRMAGYYKDEEATNKVVKDGWIYTGDLGALDEEGYLKITGRKKDIIIRGGENISPLDIERVLKRSEYVRDIVVVGIPDEVMGQEIGAFVIGSEKGKMLGQEALIDKVKTYAEAHLAKYERPRYIQIVDKYPLTGSGKVQKFKLSQMIKA